MQPGGSVRDEEVIAAARAANILCFDAGPTLSHTPNHG